MTRHYPITITQARYGGAYEGGEWIAFHLHPREIPEQAFGDDATCIGWWLDYGDGVGRGATAERAREDLVNIDEPLQIIRGRGAGEPQLARAPWRR